ncbi:MAG TPA: DUF58 domain-containing protein [Puia sp.]|jgi:uncharacterized protein (DUF58 family)|nr:DUF58 domain-containing protein [Puia sp.]
MKPEEIIAIKDLSLAARRTIDGFMAGINRSKVRGPGLEFSQYRSYQPGDDLRSLDWKRYARSDRYYIRESEIETSISIRLLVDASNSMGHRDGTITKMAYARWLAASLAWLAHYQGDALGLYVFREGRVSVLPARKDAQHLERTWHQLEMLEPGGSFGDPIDYKHIFLGEQKRELLIFITDLYERNGEITRLLELLASLRHEIIVFHVMGRNEIEGDYTGVAEVEDLETGARVVLNASDREAYRARMAGWLSARRMQLLDQQIVYQLLRIDQPLDKALRDFLQQRQLMTG